MSTEINVELPLSGYVVSLNDRLRLTIPPQTQVLAIKESNKSRPFGCVGNPDVLTKGQCEENGQVWDRPCMHDSECPFYLINANEQGGCLGGYCEMPVNVQRAGYRYYRHDDTSYPICKGCDIDKPYDASCCQKIVFPNT
jgi:hypothetical protein